jgi:replication-associated recombination protein RarA
MSDYKLETIGGHSFYTVASAIQKYVRRGDEHKALYWFSELFMSGFDNYAWKRIKVMVSEDVGLANPMLPAQIHALYQTYVEMKKEKNKHCPEKLPFVHAVLLLVRSPKSRIVDNLLCQYFDLRNNIQTPEFDDYVYCLHTIEGKKKGRGNRHFYEEAATITNDVMPDEYEIRDKVAQQYYDRDARNKPVSKTEETYNPQLF